MPSRPVVLTRPSSPVGNGAKSAFDHLFPQAARQPSITPEVLLGRLLAHLRQNADAMEPRLLHMMRWSGKLIREHYGAAIGDCVEDGIGAVDLQVTLCEWRKFRNAIDKAKVVVRWPVQRGPGPPEAGSAAYSTAGRPPWGAQAQG